MDPNSLQLRLARRLRARPSALLWRREIEALSTGERDADLREIGSRRQYVLRVLLDSSDHQQARVAFESALESTVASWKPQERSAEYNRSLLELLRAFTPKNGFQRLMATLVNFGFSGRYDETDSRENPQLATSALITLEAYYLASPANSESDRGFRDYHNLLIKLSETEEHAPYACRRLIELGLIDVGDRQVKEMVKMPGVLTEFLQYALGPHRGMLQHQIGPMLSQCLSIRNTDERGHPHPFYEAFKAELARHGAQLQPGPRRFPLGLRLENGEQFELLMSESSLADYMESAGYEERVKVLKEAIGGAWKKTT